MFKEDGNNQRLLLRPSAHVLLLSWIGAALLLCGCSSISENRISRAVCPPDVKIMYYHYEANMRLLEELMVRLYRKNPCYEPDLHERQRKRQCLFEKKKWGSCSDLDGHGCRFLLKPSHELLSMAFSEDPCYPDRVFLLILGLKKGLDEAYGPVHGIFISGCQIKAERLKRLYENIAKANWRLKTYRSRTTGELLFRTNEASDSGYINMGYEVIFTTMLTRIRDDIYLRTGLEGNLAVNLGATFLAVL